MPDTTNQLDEFYVGYLKAPPRTLRAAWVITAALAVFAAVAAGWLANAHDQPGTGAWDTGNARTFRGVLTTAPFPILHLSEASRDIPAGTSLMVVEMGKHGSQERLKTADSHQATLVGFVLRREGRVMIELDPSNEAVSVGEVAPAPPETQESVVDLEGEIVDAKCWLGAMQPGAARVHRECAMRCVDAGIPPMIVTYGNGQQAVCALVAPAVGERLTESQWSMIGLPVHARGRLTMLGTLAILRVEADGISHWSRPEKAFKQEAE
jgi:hypothetical protein